MKKLKKITAKKRTVAKSSHKHTRTVSAQPVTFYRRIFIFGSLAVVLAIIALPNQANLRQAVQGVSVQYGQFDKAVIPLPSIPGAVSYNIYYGLQSQKTFTNAARAIPAGYATYEINYLRLNTTYQYKISAKDVHGKEFYWSPVQAITNESPM